jgi:hypothetical protein
MENNPVALQIIKPNEDLRGGVIALITRRILYHFNGHVND